MTGPIDLDAERERRERLLLCGECDRTFDSAGRLVTLDGLLSGRGEIFTCPGCRPEVNRARAAQRLKSSGMPAGLTGLSFDNPRLGGEPAAVAAARDWADGTLNGLVLVGPVGVGKTYLAAIAAGARLAVEGVTWVSVPSLIIRALAAFDTDERDAAITELTGRGTLVLDDLDKVKPSDWVLSQLFAAIDGRVAEGAGLLVTTNLEPREIRDKLGEPIASRLVGHCRICRIEGRDRRLMR